MRTIRYSLFFAVVLAAILVATRAWSQDGLGERIGQTIDKAAEQVRQEAGELAEDLRAGFAKAKNAVDRMSLEARVYARLHWDKALGDAELSVDIEDGAVVVDGVVSSDEARVKAGRLAEDTVGVARVVNRLKVAAVARQ